PFLPVCERKVVACPQVPTTLPTLDELIGLDGLGPDSVAAHLLEATGSVCADLVYPLHAELEGLKLAPIFEQLLAGWKRQGYRLTSTGAYFESLDVTRLPRHAVTFGGVPGRSGALALQGAAVAP
ncbi:MAG: 4-deoxy-4-formamido-L-arabinose-phosphoundecaprenol deformylase, partial [Vicinamibacterales bacterium]